MAKLMYTLHPPGNRLQAFATSTLVEATRNNVTLKFSEFLELRRTVEQLANAIEESEPDLIPFFATGGIPFMFPAMHVLYDRKKYNLVDGTRFHMFPGLSWNGKLGDIDSESFFSKKFGSLIEAQALKNEPVRIWTMDATFTGNAILKLLKALHRCFSEMHKVPKSVSISIVAVIDASRANTVPNDQNLPLETPFGTVYLERPKDFEPLSDLKDRQRCQFQRTDGGDLFQVDITFWTLPVIPTEDRAELIGAHAKKNVLGITAKNQIGRLAVEFANGYSPSGTGGGSLASKILNWLSKSENQLPWKKWIELARSEPVRDEEREDYEEGKRQTTAGLRIWELLTSGPSTADVVNGLLKQQGLLQDVEVYCLKQHALSEFSKAGRVQPTSFPGKILRKALASAKANSNATDDALILFRVCRLEIAATEPQDIEPQELLMWWDAKLGRE